MNRHTTDANKTDEQLLCEFIYAVMTAEGVSKGDRKAMLELGNGDMEKGIGVSVREEAKRLCEYDRLGTCPKCGSIMVRSNLNSNSLLTIPFPMLEKYGWVCVKCHEIVGCTCDGTDIFHAFPMPVRHISISDGMTFEINNPGDKVELPYEMPAIKWFWMRRDECKLVIDKNGLTFTDIDDSKYSFHISPAQLQRATFKQKGNVATDIRLSNGAKYEIEYEKEYLHNKHEEIVAAIHLVIKCN